MGVQLVRLLLACGRLAPFAGNGDSSAGGETGQTRQQATGRAAPRWQAHLGTHPAACSGLKTTCNGASEEPSPTAAKATRFCLRTERTQPSTQTLSPWRGWASRRATDEASRTV